MTHMKLFILGTKCGIILDGQLKQFDDPYNVYHFPNSIEVVKFLNQWNFNSCKSYRRKHIRK